ncbi:DMT family transporter [Nocardioides sp. TRM66260-LWL]|uniref:EamA family transporter n=1 Tax=Nocardioides sp. TRM66260-LWL TaxID=2874478 RepID=UPI001CC5CCCB|nr:EamA family transporter [Nocardioides sp. TRM66260-LWL]MBZ5734234.1 DMT family transporter [Nocardioides sp. TRM66260-LWL]
MTTMTHDARSGRGYGDGSGPALSRTGAGLLWAVVSAASFGMSGALARGLLDAGWTPGSIVLVRVALAAAVVLPFGLRALRGRWELVTGNLLTITLYGVLAVAAAQFCYFSAVQHMQVGPALLIEYTAPAAVVAWMWLRHGQRPGALTLVGAGVAALGLVLVLDLFAGASVSLVGVAWALAAMVGCAVYFLISADEGNGLPPISLAAGGLTVGAVSLGALGAVGLLPMQASTADAGYSGHAVAWWVPLVVLGLVTAALAYTSGIQASRLLGSRLASFVALLEVVSAVLFAWLLLGELPGPVQMAGGLLILVGVVGVKLGERRTAEVEVLPPVDEAPAV